MQNLAQIKRALKIPYVQIRVIAHWQPQLVGTIRKPIKIQTNGYWFMGPDRAGKIVRIWAPIPKAAELAFNQDGSVTFYPGAERTWTVVFESWNEAVSNAK